MTEWRVPAVISRVVDGDTVYVTLDLGWHISLHSSLRVAGIDCPEMNTPEGKAARARALEVLPVGQPVTVVSHKLDKYGRVLADVLLPGGGSYGEIMLREGHARVAPW